MGSEMCIRDSCSLLRVGERLWVIDLQSANGTLIASEPIQCEPLVVGQSLRAGTHRVHFTRLHTDERLEALETERRNKSDQHQGELQAVRLREAEALDSLALAHAAERSAASRVEQSQIVTQKLEVESQGLRSEVAELNDNLANANSERGEAASQLEVSHKEADRLRSQFDELKARAETLERDLAETRSLLNDKESLRQREVQLETMQRELALERQILHELQLGVDSSADAVGEPNKSEEDNVITSFDFQDVLEEALDGLPSIKDD